LSAPTTTTAPNGSATIEGRSVCITAVISKRYSATTTRTSGIAKCIITHVETKKTNLRSYHPKVSIK
jgi:hypothetical protein